MKQTTIACLISSKCKAKYFYLQSPKFHPQFIWLVKNVTPSMSLSCNLQSVANQQTYFLGKYLRKLVRFKRVSLTVKRTSITFYIIYFSLFPQFSACNDQALKSMSVSLFRYIYSIFPPYTWLKKSIVSLSYEGWRAQALHMSLVTIQGLDQPYMAAISNSLGISNRNSSYTSYFTDLLLAVLILQSIKRTTFINRQYCEYDQSFTFDISCLAYLESNKRPYILLGKDARQLYRLALIDRFFSIRVKN